jgi:hypothetical protein
MPTMLAVPAQRGGRGGVGGDVEVFVQPGIGLADLGLAVLEQQPVPLVGPEPGEVQPDDHALVREPVPPERVAPHRASVYVNFLDSDDGTSRVREAYGDANHRRLIEVKATYDPENVFHHNKNIQPAPAAR